MRNTEISKEIQYIRDVFVEEDNLLKKANNYSINYALPINIGPEEGKLLQVLIGLVDAKTIVEVGTLSAYSTIWLARAIEGEGKVYSFEKNQEYYDLAKEIVKDSDVENRIDIFQGDAGVSLKKIEDKAPFDMIFIDADKIGYCKYLDWAEKNIKKGGLIVGDNSLLFGAVCKDELPDGVRKLAKDVMIEFNKRLSDKTKYKSILLPTKEGMTIAKKLF